jgi:hypothetical protein
MAKKIGPIPRKSKHSLRKCKNAADIEEERNCPIQDLLLSQFVVV